MHAVFNNWINSLLICTNMNFDPKKFLAIQYGKGLAIGLNQG